MELMDHMVISMFSFWRNLHTGCLVAFVSDCAWRCCQFRNTWGPHVGLYYSRSPHRHFLSWCKSCGSYYDCKILLSNNQEGALIKQRLLLSYLEGHTGQWPVWRGGGSTELGFCLYWSARVGWLSKNQGAGRDAGSLSWLSRLPKVF